MRWAGARGAVAKERGLLNLCEGVTSRQLLYCVVWRRASSQSDGGLCNKYITTSCLPEDFAWSGC